MLNFSIFGLGIIISIESQSELLFPELAVGMKLICHIVYYGKVVANTR